MRRQFVRRGRNVSRLSALVIGMALIGVAPRVTTAAGPAVDRSADVVCETLMADYILRVGKIESDTVNAAIELIAARGRNNGYWQTVLDEFRKSDPSDSQSPSPNLLAILTEMLAVDGHARWLRSRPEELKTSAWAADVRLSPAVLEAILAKAPAAARFQFDRYVQAVVAAHDDRAKEFLLGVLNRRADGRAADSFPIAGDQEVEFHAAAGLANLGHRPGMAWLVEAPLGDTPMLEKRIHALQDLTGLKYKTFEEWRAWWQTNPLPDPFAPTSRVRSHDR